MPDDLQLTARHHDPYAWALAQAALLGRGAAGLNSIDAARHSANSSKNGPTKCCPRYAASWSI